MRLRSNTYVSPQATIRRIGHNDEHTVYCGHVKIAWDPQTTVDVRPIKRTRQSRARTGRQLQSLLPVTHGWSHSTQQSPAVERIVLTDHAASACLTTETSAWALPWMYTKTNSEHGSEISSHDGSSYIFLSGVGAMAPQRPGEILDLRLEVGDLPESYMFLEKKWLI